MKIIAVTFAVALVALICGCQTKFAPKSLAQKTITFSYDDFGPESLASQWLGPRDPAARIVIHHGQTENTLRRRHPEPGNRFITARRALYHTGRTLRQLPAGSAGRTRVRATFTALRAFDNDRRAAASAVPPFAGRGASRRMALIH
ncbi:MAG TPA: hypothetical protein VD994_03990 [Prosthecobacter sp.]|nr:hypothetical protein [Prosthecobacter sp.]